MSVTFQLHQVTVIAAQPNGATYTVTNTLVTATGADKNVFCFKQTDNTFSHYATAADMNLWPSTNTPGQAYYRKDVLARTWDNVAAMVEDVNLTLSRVQLLANEIAAEQGNLVIDRTTNVTAGS